MRIALFACLAALVTWTSLAEPAHAGRRQRRRAAAVGAGVGVGVAAATTRRPAVAAAAAPVVVAPAAVTRTVYVSSLPDLTISGMSVEGDLHTVTITNIGRTGSPESELRIDFRRMADGAPVATKLVRVPPLLVNQSLRFRLLALPLGHLRAAGQVDPDNRMAELNEQNNDRVLEIVNQPRIAPAPLEDVEVLVAPAVEGNR
jgi:hypothetical protein